MKKVHRVMKLNQEAWREQYIDINTQLRKYAEQGFSGNF